MSNPLLKSGLIVSAMTFLSRILGLIRDVIVANFIGAGVAADVFIFANKIPNFLRRLFAEGAFAQAFIPVLTEVHEKGDRDELKLFIARTSGTLGTIVILVSILGVIGSPVLVALFGTGWFIESLNSSEPSSKFELASLMLKITFPYLMFISLAGLAGAILNTLNKFAVAAFTPVLLNVAIISCAIWLSPHLSEPAFALAWGVFIGGILQLFFQLPFVFKAGLVSRPRWGWQDEQVTKVRKLMIPALFGVSVGQLNLLLDTVIASFLATGSISWLYYSDRLLEFPLGLFGIAIATVILPTLSRNFVKSDDAAFAANMDWAVRMILLLGVPASAGLMILAEPMLLVIFQRGEFDFADTQAAALSLMAYGAGLLFFMLIKVFAPGFFSRQDTKTPVKIGIYCMFANMLFNLLLVWPFGYIGLAMATTLSAAMNAALLYFILSKRKVYQLSAETWIFALKIVISVAVMITGLWVFKWDIQAWLEWSLFGKIIALTKLILLGGFSYLAMLLLLGVRPAHLRASTVA